MEVTEIAKTVVFSLIPGCIILATLVFGIVHQGKSVSAPDFRSSGSRYDPLDDMVMCLADVSVSPDQEFE